MSPPRHRDPTERLRETAGRTRGAGLPGPLLGLFTPVPQRMLKMKSRSRIRRRPGCGAAALSPEKQLWSQHERAPVRNITTAAHRLMIGPAGGHRRHGWPFEEPSTKRGTAHALLSDGQSLHSSNAIGADDMLPNSRRRKRAHPPAVSVPGSTNGKSFSRRSRRYRRPSALPMATAAAALATLAALSALGILASAAETDSAVPMPREQELPDDIVRGPGSSSRRAGNLRRKGDNNHPRQDMNVNAEDARHLSRVFADGRPSSNGFDFDVSFLDAPANTRDDNYYGDPVLVTEMGRPQDNEEQEEETISDMYDNSNPTLAALLDADNHHHRPSSTSTTPLTDALTSSSSTVQARIVGGTMTPRPPNLRYPYMVSLQRRDYPICGAFLIAPDCILTAAHCRGSFDYAELGRWDLAADATESYPAPFGIVECTMHPSFTYFVDGRIGNDFMVCKLDRKADVDRYPPVQLNANPAVPQTSEAVTVVGWGRTSSGGARSDQQRQATIRVVSNNQCRQAQGCIAPGQCYGYQNIIKSNMLCAHFDGADKRDSCQGDSGGPLIVPGKEEDGSGDTIVGIVSFGVGCAEELFPGSTPGSARPTPGSSPRRNGCPITVESASTRPSLPLRPPRAQPVSQHRLPRHLRPLCLLPRQRHKRVLNPQACRR